MKKAGRFNDLPYSALSDFYCSRDIVSIATSFGIYATVMFELVIEIRCVLWLGTWPDDGRFDGHTGFLLRISLLSLEVITKRLPLERGNVNPPLSHSLALVTCSNELELAIGRNVGFHELSRFPALVTLDTDTAPSHIHHLIFSFCDVLISFYTNPKICALRVDFLIVFSTSFEHPFDKLRTSRPRLSSKVIQ